MNNSNGWIRAETSFSDIGKFYLNIQAGNSFSLVSTQFDLPLRVDKDSNETLRLDGSSKYTNFIFDTANTQGDSGLDLSSMSISDFMNKKIYLKTPELQRAFGFTSSGFIQSWSIPDNQRARIYLFIETLSSSAYKLAKSGIVSALQSGVNCISVSNNGVLISSGFFDIATQTLPEMSFSTDGKFLPSSTYWTYDNNKFTTNKSPYNTTILTVDSPNLIKTLKCSPFDDSCIVDIPSQNRFLMYADDKGELISDFITPDICYDLEGNSKNCRDLTTRFDVIRKEAPPSRMDMFRFDINSRYPSDQPIISPTCPMIDTSKNKYQNIVKVGTENSSAFNTGTIKSEDIFDTVSFSLPNITSYEDTTQEIKDNLRKCCSGDNSIIVSIKRFNDSPILVSKYLNGR
jgi:hypothetical protein